MPIDYLDTITGYVGLGNMAQTIAITERRHWGTVGAVKWQTPVLDPCPCSPTGAHHWIIKGVQQRGKCKHCKRVKYFHRATENDAKVLAQFNKKVSYKGPKTHPYAYTHHCIICGRDWDSWLDNPKKCGRRDCRSRKWKEIMA